MSDAVQFDLRVNGQIDQDRSWWFPTKPGVLPPASNRIRVHGGDIASSFMLEGYSAFVKIERAVQASTDCDYGSFSSILDWGVGCGRVSRYFADRVAQGVVHGIDIDAANIDYCQSAYPFLRATLISTTPPTPLAAKSFDLIIGVSIFTHLREVDIRAWATELARLAAPNGIVAVTTHGTETLRRAGLLARDRRIFDETGFVDVGDNPNIDGAVAEDATYYRNVFTRRAWFVEVVSPWFDVLAVREGYIGGHQDLFILRRRRS